MVDMCDMERECPGCGNLDECWKPVWMPFQVYEYCTERIRERKLSRTAFVLFMFYCHRADGSGSWKGTNSAITETLGISGNVGKYNHELVENDLIRLSIRTWGGYGQQPVTVHAVTVPFLSAAKALGKGER